MYSLSFPLLLYRFFHLEFVHLTITPTIYIISSIMYYFHLNSFCYCHVFSGSMEPAFYRGDLLFLTNYEEEPVRVGEIVVFKIEGRDIPIVHRVLKVHEK